MAKIRTMALALKTNKSIILNEKRNIIRLEQEENILIYSFYKKDLWLKDSEIEDYIEHPEVLPYDRGEVSIVNTSVANAIDSIVKKAG